MSLLSKIKEQFLQMLPPALFFFVAFHIVALVHSLMLRSEGVPPTVTLSLLVAALALGRVVLTADMLPFINRYPEKPLIYNVVWKTVIYTMVSLVLHYLKDLIGHWRKAGSLAAANRQLFEDIVWPRFAALQIMLVVMIFVYCVGRELTRILGPQTMRELFFGKPSLAGTAVKGVTRKA
jgi:hypothetical protein